MDESVTTRPNPRPSLHLSVPATGGALPGVANGVVNGVGDGVVNGVGDGGPAYLRRRIAALCRSLTVLAALLALLPQFAVSQVLPDPTRPAIGTSQSGDAEEAIAGPQLQSILISPTRKLAVINGQTLHVGARFGNAVVVKINAQEVVLKSGNELQTLKLFPGVEKRKSSAGKVASQK